MFNVILMLGTKPLLFELNWSGFIWNLINHLFNNNITIYMDEETVIMKFILTVILI